MRVRKISRVSRCVLAAFGGAGTRAAFEAGSEAAAAALVGRVLPAFGEEAGGAGVETGPGTLAFDACACGCGGAAVLRARVNGDEHSGQLAVIPSSVSSQVSVPWQWGQVMWVALIERERSGRIVRKPPRVRQARRASK